MTPLAERLAARTLELVNIPSESGHEDAIREHLLTLVPPSYVESFAGDEVFLFVPARRPGIPLVVLAGHYDTVPAQENLPGRIGDGAVHGLGASDMKSGVAVALELVRDLAETPPRRPTWDCSCSAARSCRSSTTPSPRSSTTREVVHEAALAILLEPTDGVVHAGCLGNVIARLTFHGRSGHSARPWDADNAIAHAVEGLRPLLTVEPRRAVVGELAVCRGPLGDPARVRDRGQRHPGQRDGDAQPSLPAGPLARRGGSAPALARSCGRDVGDREPCARRSRRHRKSRSSTHSSAPDAREIQPKQAWTNVADFTAHGIDAVNFGPGHTRYAHRRDEQVEIAALVHAYETLHRLVRGAIGEDGA